MVIKDVSASKSSASPELIATIERYKTLGDKPLDKKKPGRPPKASFESRHKSAQPLSPDEKIDMSKALTSEGRKAIQAEIAEGRPAADKLASTAKQEMEQSIERVVQAEKLKYQRTLREDVAPIVAECDRKERVLNVVDEDAIREELEDAMIRCWARKRKANPTGWREEVYSEIEELLDRDYSFYAALSRLIGKSPEVIRKAIKREFDLLK